jgi:hypothetical protein
MVPILLSFNLHLVLRHGSSKYVSGGIMLNVRSPEVVCGVGTRRQEILH